MTIERKEKEGKWQEGERTLEKKLGGEKREERRKNGMGKVEIYCEKKKNGKKECKYGKTN